MRILRTGPGLVLVGAALWGTTGTAQALGPEGITPETVSVLRMTGGATLLLVAGLSGGWRSPWSLPRAALLIAVAAMAASQPLFFAGVDRTGVAVGTVLTIGSGPVIAGLMARLVRGEHLGARWMLATAVAVGGVVLMVSGGASAGIDGAGVLFALGAGVAWPVYLLAAKALFEEADPILVVGTVFTGAAVVLSPFLVFGDPSWVAESRGVAVALWLALVATALSYVFFSIGLQRTAVGVSATLTLAEPVTASILGMSILDEPLVASTAFGIGLVVTALLLLALDPVVSAGGVIDSDRDRPD